MKFSGFIMASALLVAVSGYKVQAQSSPVLGAAKSYAVLAGASIVNSGATVVNGNLGVSPGTSITGFPPGTVNGGQTYTGSGSNAAAAQTDALAAYNDLAGRPKAPANMLTGRVLGQSTGAVSLRPGVYTFTSAAQLSGTLTLNDGGDPNAVYIFQIAGSFATANSSKVVMSSGGKGLNVYWQVAGSVSVAPSTSFLGNIIANANIVMGNSATTTGRLIALNSSIVMDTNNATAVAVQVTDTDGDGVPDSMDDYPNDATKAYNNYSSPGSGSTIAFEDQWPLRGDFDMNDLVMVYKYNVVTNAQNVVVQVIGNYTLVAGGGGFANGFGVEFPIPGASVKNLTGATLEAGQSKAVIVLFNNMHNELSAWNTQNGVATSPAKSYTVTFDVANGPVFSQFGTDYNPFIFNYTGQSRSEVHLAGKTPTALADPALFGTKDDDSNAGTGRYYVTKTGLPFAITMPTATFAYPIEGIDISKAYTHFGDWAQSGGVSFLDWFSNTGADYRNSSQIYTKPN